MNAEQLTITTANGNWLCQGIQLRERLLVPRWLGRFILWLFFHRTDTATQVTLSGFTEQRNSAKKVYGTTNHAGDRRRETP